MLCKTPNHLIILVALFIQSFSNQSLIAQILKIYPLSWQNSAFLLSLFIVFWCFIIFLFSLVCFRPICKFILIAFLLLSSQAAYFMDSYQVIIDNDMIDNLFKTDVNETLDLLSLKQLGYFVFLGLLPSIYVYRCSFKQQSIKRQLWQQLKLILGSLIIAIVCILSFSQHYASFFREHKIARFYANPSFYVFSFSSYIGQKVFSAHTEFRHIANDARLENNDAKKNLVILVIGETVRSDHLSLNAYARQTMPLLSKQNIISFNNVWACGTSTAVSVPCMFSHLAKNDYDKSSAYYSENILDILQKTGVYVHWLDNNSDSKGVALRIPYGNYKLSSINSKCDSECRDEGMLLALPEIIEKNKNHHQLYVLHQMGNHGPAYYKRYPKNFERFTPACQTNQLEQCSVDEINNAYDNAILYTDYVLNQTIELLKQYQGNYKTSLIYISDHGESLGENGLYLHGLPYLFAPDTQKQIPMIIWHDQSSQANYYPILQQLKHAELSHDHLFHSLLGLFSVKTQIYQSALDIYSNVER